MKKIMFVSLLCVGGVQAASAKTIAFWPFGAEGGRDATGQGNDLEYDANVQIGETAVLNGKHTLFSTKNALDLSCTKAITVEFWAKFNAGDNPAPVMLMELSEQTGPQVLNSFYVDFAEKTAGRRLIGSIWTMFSRRRIVVRISTAEAISFRLRMPRSSSADVVGCPRKTAITSPWARSTTCG